MQQEVESVIDDQNDKSVPALPPAPGFTWELFCITVIFLTALGLSVVFIISSVNNNDPGLFLAVTALIFVLLTLKLTPRLADKYRARQRHAFLRAEEVIRNDKRPPVLYLRSFKDDESIARAIAFYSIEQEMRVVLHEIGPFITMGEPDKGPPKDPGAARMYLPLDGWKETVSNEMSKAGLVVMRIADSGGFWWEVQEAPRRVRPERLVFLVPPEQTVLYEEFQRKASELLNWKLPEYRRKWSPLGDHGGIIYFEPDWTPHLRKFKVVWLRQTFWNLFSATLKIGMKPVYEQLGVKWTKPPVQPAQVIYLLALSLLAVLAIYLIYSFTLQFRQDFGI
jgi:hypothetical protein